MILQALKDYYDRKAADPESGIAPLGWEWKEIPYLVVVAEDGRFIRLEDTQEVCGNKKRAKSFLVPSLGEAKGNGTKSNLFWENGEYFFGFPMDEDKLRQDGEKYLSKVKERHAAFVQKIQKYESALSSNSCFMGVSLFLQNLDMAKIRQDPLWVKALQLNQTFLFAIVNKGPVTDVSDIRDGVNTVLKSIRMSKETVRCMVTGLMDAKSNLEAPIKGVVNASTMGAHIVAVNNKISSSGNSGATPAFASFMKQQGENSPIGQVASLAYTTALNTLLSKDSKQKMMVGDATVVFWAEKDNPFETALADFFAEPPKDNPDRLVGSVSALFRSPQTGTGVYAEDETTFYVLGLSPNAARIAIRFWHVGTVAEMAGRFRAYFDDLLIVHGPKDRDHLSLWRLLVSTAVQGKSENIAPNLAGNVMRSILEGLPFPETLLSDVLTRIKAEHEVSYPRAKLVKGCLNRKWRFNNPQNERKLTVSLDKENVNVGYRLGRLFAVLERIQKAANPKINATIKDRFYASASSTPTSVFGNLIRLSNHHLSKLRKERPGYAVNLEKLMQEVIAGIARFPAHLSLDDQGQFAIGYYHQRQDPQKKDAEEQPVNK